VLFDPNAHERLTEESWEPGRVYAALREIVEDAEGAFDNGWPTHPQDSEQDSDEERRFRTVYMGGAGVVQALDSLQRRGLLELRGDYAPYLEQRYEPDFPDADHERSLWMGETGIRLTLQRLSPSRENADRLHELIGANTQDERREVMWGSPGTMLAAAAMHDLTGEARWLDLWRESAAWLRGEWDPQTGLWTQQLYGMVDQFIGPAHGFAGCVLALSRDARRRGSSARGGGDAPLRSRGGRPRELAADLDGESETRPRRANPPAVVSRCAWRCRITRRRGARRRRA